MGSTLSNLKKSLNKTSTKTSTTPSTEMSNYKIYGGITSYCCFCLCICLIVIWLLMKKKSGKPIHYIGRSAGRMPYGPSGLNPGNFSASSPMMMY